MSAFLHRKLTRLESEVASLLECGQAVRAAEKQREICRLVDENGGGDVNTRSLQLSRLAEIQTEALLHREAYESREQARTLLAEHLRERFPELLEAPVGQKGIRHGTLDYDVGTARLLNRLAMLYHRTGSSSDARPLLERAMAITRPQLGVGHPDFAILLANFAGVQHALGRSEEAESLYRQALDVLRVGLGNEHPEVAETQGELAQLFHDLGRWKEALSWYEKALETLTGIYGEDHVALVDLLGRLGALRLQVGDLTAAEWDLLKAQRIQSASGAGGELREASILERLAEVYRRMEDFAASERVGRQALAIRRAVLGSDHPDCAVSANNLAVVCHQSGRLAEAEELYEQACGVLRDAPGAATRKLLGSLANLEQLYAQEGRTRRALAVRREIQQLRAHEPCGNVLESFLCELARAPGPEAEGH